MAATQYAIASKHRRINLYTANIHDFTLGEGRSFPDNQVVSDHSLSLYCLDDENRRAIFVELADDVDLTEAAFIYLTHYENARRIVTVPYETFISLGDALPPEQRPIMIYILGRSGSTLVSHASINQVRLSAFPSPTSAPSSPNFGPDPEAAAMMNCAGWPAAALAFYSVSIPRTMARLTLSSCDSKLYRRRISFRLLCLA